MIYLFVLIIFIFLKAISCQLADNPTETPLRFWDIKRFFPDRESLGIWIQKNVLVPILWLCTIISLPCFYLASEGAKELQMIFIVIGFVPIGLFVISYLFFMFSDPNRLQSEEYQIRRRSLDLIESKTEGLEVDPINFQSIMNPYPTPKRLSGPDAAESGND